MKAFEEHEQWNAVKEVCSRLSGAGHEALLAGGSVRDVLMGRQPNDFDIATSATPDQVEALFPRAVGVGKAFGVIVLPFTGFQIEVATFREDLEYKDGRRPEGVKFSDAKADSKRRDFTVNALFFDPLKNQVIDYVDGRKDIDRKILRTVGDPNDRFNEDKLRLLRAVRFAAQLGFDIESKTLQAVVERANEVNVVSRERIRDELLKLLKVPCRVKGLELLLSTGLLSGAFPDSAPFIIDDETQWLKRFESLNGGKFPDAILLALFLSSVFTRTGEADFRERHLKSLKLDNDLMFEVSYLLRHLPIAFAPTQVRRGELAKILLDAKAKHLLEVARIFETSGSAENVEVEREKFMADILRIARAHQVPYLNGADLKAEGFTPGPRMGEILNEALLLQFEGVMTSRDLALEWLKKQKA